MAAGNGNWNIWGDTFNGKFAEPGLRSPGSSPGPALVTPLCLSFLVQTEVGNVSISKIVTVRFPWLILASGVAVGVSRVRTPLPSLRTDIGIADPLPHLEKPRLRTKGCFQEPRLGSGLLDHTPSPRSLSN